MSNKIISKEELEILINNGELLKDIAARLNLSYGSLKNIASRYGLKSNRKFSPDGYKSEIIDLYVNKNLTAKQISEKIGVYKGQIWEALKRWGISTKSKGEREKEKSTLSEEQINKIKTMAEQGYSYNLVSEEIGINKDILIRMSEELKIQFTGKIKQNRIVECVFCKKQFESTGNHHNTCSDECKIKYRYSTLQGKTDFFCLYCGKQFMPCYANDNPLFCGKSCATTYNQSKMSPEQKSMNNQKCIESKIKNGTMYRSKAEVEITNFLLQYIPNIISNSWNIIAGDEIDIYLPEYQLAIEYCGLYWHSELNGKKSMNYHLDKLNKCRNLGIKLITIFEDEWLHKKEIVKSRLLNFIGKNERIYARECEIRSIENKIANEFCDNNHIQGHGRSVISYGLFFNNNLVSVMVFDNINRSKSSNKEDISNKNNYELSRFCNILNKGVIGGASRLLKAFLKDHRVNKLISYADLRWSNGDLYDKLGFSLHHESRPNYWYITDFSKLIRKHRYGFRKDENCPEGLTEWEYRITQGLDRIWDCGNQCWLISLNQ